MFAKINPLPNDNVFQDALDPQCDTFFREGANISVQHSDLLHVSARILPAFNGCDSLAQRGLTTLVSSNGGGSWEKHHYELPGYEKEYLFGDLQYIKATPHLYCFNNGHINENGYRYEGAFNESWNRGGQGFYSPGGDSYFNTSYLYSSDYGATWTPEHAYGNRRRAYEAVAKDEVWMTVSRQDDIHVLGRKASVIVQTTDNGKSWHEDKLTMNESDIGEFDGRIISFSDPKHGWIAATKDGQTYVFRYTANTPSGVEADDDTDPANATFRIKAYPNPATETMNILLPKFQTITKIEVYDMLGRQRPVDVTMNANTAAISTHELSAGCYIARTTTLRGTRLMTSFAVMR